MAMGKQAHAGLSLAQPQLPPRPVAASPQPSATAEAPPPLRGCTHTHLVKGL